MIAKYVAVVALIVAATAACGRHSSSPLCTHSEFEASPYDHIMEDMPAGIHTSEFVGRLRTNPRDIEGGIWPPGLDASIEIHGPNGFSEFVDVAVDGTFARRGLPPGTYCFKIAAAGFRSMFGTLQVDKRRASASAIEIELMLAE